MTDPNGGPAVILVRPQLGENIGAAARAMLNCGLTRLRLVAPRDGWPNPAAWPMAVGADGILETAEVYPTTPEAVADLAQVFATTARSRDLAKPVVTARVLGERLAARPAADLARTGVLFGGERSGLDNEDVTLADGVVTIPLNPAFSSLNLAQAVLLVGYEWAMARGGAAARAETGWRAADKAVLHTFFGHLEQELDAAGFFRAPEMRAGMVRNIRTLFQRTNASEAEVRTLHGIVTALSGRRLGGRPRGRGPADPPGEA